MGLERFVYWVERVNGVVNSVVWGPAVLMLILVVGVQFSCRLGFFQLTRLGLWWSKTVNPLFRREKREQKDRKAISPFQALTTALAGSIGTGNIVGVATALTLGGPGAIFWMWLAAFFGMMTIFAENVLGVRYRVRNQRGEWAGGAMYYIERGIGCKWLAVIFAAACVLASFGMGNMTQSNSIAGALWETFSVPPLWTGVAVAALCGVIIFGGIKRISKVTEKIVPFMAVFYMVGGLVVVAANYRAVPGAFGEIFRQAFSLEAAAGGAGGYVIARAMKFGIARGVFTNEAGLGSSPIVHAAAETDEPVEQGMWGMFQVFIDTIVVCTMTALCILCTGVLSTGKQGVALSTAAFETVFGRFGAVFVAVSIAFFAFATLIGWSFYGERSVEYLAGERLLPVYRLLFAAAAALGCVMDLQLAWDISDTFNGLMAIPNLIALLLLSGEVVKVTRDYLERRERPSESPGQTLIRGLPDGRGKKSGRGQNTRRLCRQAKK